MDGQKKILIVGAGFGGLATALALERRNIPNLKIVLVSDKPHFEYTPALYRVVTGKTPLEVCIPITEILSGKNIEFNQDEIIEVRPQEKVAVGQSGSSYSFDYLVLALGSETAYFDIPGVENFSLSFKSISQALKLKGHLHKLFEECRSRAGGLWPRLNIAVVGAGSSGVELAGELAVYAKQVAVGHNLPRSVASVNLFEAAPRILPNLPPAVSRRVEKRLRELGVNVFTGRPIESQDLEEVKLKGMTLGTKTVIWTAGAKPNSLYQKINGLQFDKYGRVLVDEHLQAKGQKNIFIIGDAAATPYSGMAQTAISEGFLVTENIRRELAGKPQVPYKPRKPYYSIPVGPGWAATIIGPITVYGYLGWILRRLADLRYFLSILPFKKAILAFRSGKTLCQSCEICLPGRQAGENFSALI